MPGSARHAACRNSPILLLKTAARKRRPVYVEVPHVSPGKSRNNSRDSRRRKHASQTSKIVPTPSQCLGERRDSESDWDLQGPRCLSRCHTPLATKSQKTSTSLGGKRWLLLCPLLTNGWNELSRAPSERR